MAKEMNLKIGSKCVFIHNKDFNKESTGGGYAEMMNATCTVLNPEAVRIPLNSDSDTHLAVKYGRNFDTLHRDNLVSVKRFAELTKTHKPLYPIGTPVQVLKGNDPLRIGNITNVILRNSDEGYYYDYSVDGTTISSEYIYPADHVFEKFTVITVLESRVFGVRVDTRAAYGSEQAKSLAIALLNDRYGEGTARVILVRGEEVPITITKNVEINL